MLARSGALQRRLSSGSSSKGEWRVFLDLQCAYGQQCYEKQLPMLKGEFGDRFDFKVSLTSLPFHVNAFTAHTAVKVVEDLKGDREKFIATLYKHRDAYINSATEDLSLMEVRTKLARVAVDEGFFDHVGMFVGYLKGDLQDGQGAIDAAWKEHQESIHKHVVESPTHLVNNTTRFEGPESLAWSLDDWKAFLPTK
mmetsp:Transcript_30879/g.99624  ORF Transcript_30879/g.99624 Transcript_30879/m.99624 type:complete len:196 (+) Transcript_30879:28-615(+)|eukprot:CAMPEP_0118917666 /NCGR_PEP_ID=MMETSP1166-20130328/17459_1 /TAXON_ID=1104430 /ORGANISM="Chrysoreinhardia sp, Strain CCMP3193" /LENGTH=195 /DNA_ID=CAMNT_0006857871 /DNA_START=26 /DNA_END=613 /DNA_ORIENTATION=-